MEHKTRKKQNIYLKFLFFIATMLILFSVPFIANAAVGSLGQESPKIICTYEQDGVEVDGNTLKAGTYDVNFVLCGVNNLSVMEITATYDESQVAVESSPTYLISDNADNSVESMGCVLSGGNIVFGFVSTNEDCSSLLGEDVIVATVKMTFNSDCDAESYIKVSENPNFTFAQVDYGDGYDDSYALVETFNGYNGNLYLMDCDVTPGEYSVNGEFVVMTASNGATEGTPVHGEYVIDIYSDEDKTELVDSVLSTEIKNDDNSFKNSFCINKLKMGTYYLTVRSDYALTRYNAVIQMNGHNIDDVVIPMLCCDFDKDEMITALDAREVLQKVNDSNYIFMDIDGDELVSALDARVVLTLVAVSYQDTLVIE